MFSQNVHIPLALNFNATRKRSRSKLTAQRKIRGEIDGAAKWFLFKLDPATIGRYIHVASNVYGVHMTLVKSVGEKESSITFSESIVDAQSTSVRALSTWPQNPKPVALLQVSTIWPYVPA